MLGKWVTRSSPCDYIQNTKSHFGFWCKQLKRNGSTYDALRWVSNWYVRMYSQPKRMADIRMTHNTRPLHMRTCTWNAWESSSSVGQSVSQSEEGKTRSAKPSIGRFRWVRIAIAPDLTKYDSYGIDALRMAANLFDCSFLAIRFPTKSTVRFGWRA